MNQEMIHPLEKEKLTYLIKHHGFQEPPPPRKPDFISQYETLYLGKKNQNHDGDAAETDTPATDVVSSNERLPVSKKRKILESFTASSSDHHHPETQSKPPSLKLKISLKKIDEASRIPNKVQKIKPVSSPSKHQSPILSPTPPSSRPLTSAQVRSILAIEDCIVNDSSNGGGNCNAWVRRSTRQPSRSAISSNHVQTLIEKLKMNDPDITVLKVKKFISDPNTPQLILDAVLDALEENTNCQALYIQNFNEGIRDEQLLHLLRILQRPTCNIWCINVGEIYKVKTKTWAMFTEGLADTKVTHMYASEHIISAAMKELMREIIRDNRKKHNMHVDPDNLDVIVQCTHNWWNPINAAVLRPFLRDRGYEHLLADTVSQGIKGTHTDISKI